MSTHSISGTGTLLGRLGLMFAPVRARIGGRRHHAALDGLNDYLLRDIGLSRGANGFDRRNFKDF